MTEKFFDLVIIGAGSGGLTAAGFAAQLGASVALVEKNRVGGDCTWTGCVPSKALLKAAKIAHETRNAAHYGILVDPPKTDMARVRDYVHGAIHDVYQFETPQELEREGIEVILAAASFLDPHTICAGERVLKAKNFLITTGAHPFIPPIESLSEVPYITYENIFDIDELPESMIVVGGGPIGMEMAQAFQRLGSQVTVVCERLLPKEEIEVQTVMSRVFEREGMKFLWGRAAAARMEGGDAVVVTETGEARGKLLLVAAGRRPTVAGLDLEKAGVRLSEKGVVVDEQLRTSVKHIYAAGDVTGGHQFTHFAGWQAFQAVRNALLVGSSSGFTDIVPWVTFTDPEVAHVGLTEAQARVKFGDSVQVNRWEMSRADRAVCENDTDGFIKVTSKRDGTLLGATIVAGRAGEAITEFILALKTGLKIADLAGAIHAYPTYSTAVQQLSADAAIENLLSSATGRIIRGLSKIIR
ncbi:MAG: FAD-dependent oxidoreductase [Acidobacteria bacterium]|nr:FAD-dependent oxidoreductase [Acidobacteriota bacterium]